MPAVYTAFETTSRLTAYAQNGLYTAFQPDMEITSVFCLRSHVCMTFYSRIFTACLVCEGIYVAFLTKSPTSPSVCSNFSYQQRCSGRSACQGWVCWLSTFSRT